MLTRQDVLIDLIKTNAYKNIAEIGVHHGKTTRKILETCELDWYILVDPVWHIPLSHYLTKSGNADRVNYLIRTSESASTFAKDNSLDLVFIDALHDYDHVLQDIRLWQPQIRPGGILCGDDYDNVKCPDVKRAVVDVFGDGYKLVEIGRKGFKIWVVRL